MGGEEVGWVTHCLQCDDSRTEKSVLREQRSRRSGGDVHVHCGDEEALRLSRRVSCDWSPSLDLSQGHGQLPSGSGVLREQCREGGGLHREAG